MLVPLGFIHLLLFLRIPLDVYQASPVELASSTTSLLASLALLGMVSLLTATLVLTVTAARIAGDVRVWLIALALTFWVVDSFFGRPYPLLDGTVTRIEPDRLRLLFEFAVLLSLIGLLSRWQRFVEMPALLFLGLLTAFNAWFAAMAIGGASGPVHDRTLPPAPVSPFELSADTNLLIVLLDTFQSDFLSDALSREAALRDRLDGFVYFPDTLGVAPTTFLSLPAIHSGHYYDPQRSMSGYFDSSVRTASFLGQLGRSGFQATLVNPIRNLCPENTICITRDDLLRKPWQTTVREMLYLLDIALMRAAPEFAKNWVFNRGRFRLGAWLTSGEFTGEARLVQDDDRVLALAARKIQPTAQQPTALFLHLMNTHPPYVLDAGCTAVAQPDRPDREAAIGQIICGLRRLAALLETLERNGLRDPSMIVVLGDHGYSAPLGAPDLDSRRLSGDDRAHEPSGRLVGGANPLLLIKPPGARGRLRTDSRPASLTDVPATICATLAACTADSGYDLLAPEAPEPRSREFLAYTWEHRFWDLGYIPSVDFYEVRGPLSERASWERQPLGLRRHRIERVDASTPGRVITLGSGWAEPEPDENRVSKRWAIGNQALLFLHLDHEPGHPVAFQIDFEFYTPEFIGDQSVSLIFNGHPVASRHLEQHLQVVSFRLPADKALPGTNRIELRFKRAVAPGGDDGRIVATSFFSATLSAVERRVP